MVEQYVRWDFIGLSTDTKPTSENEKVTDGSTYYESDTSKYYVYYKGTWYEKQDTGGGTSDFEDLTNRPKYQGTAMTGETDIVAFTGTDGEANGTAGLVPAPQTTDAGKFLKADGTWDSAGGGTLYTTVGQNEDGAMTQKATTDMIFGDGGTGYKIKIGSDTTDSGDNGIAIGHSASAGASDGIAIGHTVTVSGTNGIVIGHDSRIDQNDTNAIAIGNNAIVGSSGASSICIGGSSGSAAYDGVAIGENATCGAGKNDSVALGWGAHTSYVGEVNVGTYIWNRGYNGTKYRIINGVHDGINNHCVATVAQGNTLATSAPTTATEGVLGQLYTDTTNMHTYQCTAIDTTDPNNPSYTWTQRW